MSEEDRLRWDGRYSSDELAVPGIPPVFAPYADHFPARGHALELACGTGGASVGLAAMGLDVLGVDVSAAAITKARSLALDRGLPCRFAVFDLDDGLPPGPPADLILCHMFRDRRLDGAIIERLAPGGLLALACLSEVGAGPGRFRAAAGELQTAFASLVLIGAGEGGGTAWIMARRPS